MSDKDSTAKIKCQGLAGLIFGHNYQPVFNKDPSGIKLNTEECSAYALIEAIKHLTKYTYVHTECSRCGHRIGGAA